MISAFFIYNQKGEVLISRLYRHDLKRSIADIFRIHVISNTDVRSPIITLGSTSFFHVRHENLYIAAVTKCNANAALVFEFCYRIINIGKSYFGKFDEESVKNNFVLIYELLDEVLDFGYPQNSETETLKMYITTEGVKSERAVKEDSSKITIQATGTTSWRRADIKYRKNEAFIDVIESVNLLMSTKGNILRADVSGQIMMRAYLSGTPECKFGLNDKLVLDKDPRINSVSRRANAVEIDDCQFHQCVKLGKFDSDRTINFIPPDGEFELMRYRTTENVNLPFRVHPTVNEIGKSRVEYRITVKANFSNKLYANNVVVRIPTPLNTANINVRVVSGKAKYVPADNSIVWKIPRFQGQSEFTLSGEAELSAMTVNRAWSRPPISMDFQVLMFTASGLLVRFLKVFEKSDYQSVKWVRYMTKAGSYQIRDGFFTEDGLDFTPCAREVILNACIPLTAVIASITGLFLRCLCRRSREEHPYQLISPISLDFDDHDTLEPVTITKYDLSQFIISFIHLAFVGFLFGWRFDEYFETFKYGIYWVIGAVGLFISWFYIGALNACHLITRQKQSQYAYIKHLSVLYALYAVTAAVNLRSVLKNSNREYELVFAICNAAAGLVLFALSVLRPRHPELRDGEVSHDTTASQWSLLLFSWMNSLIKLGNTRELTEADLWDLPRKCEAVRCYQELLGMANMDVLSRLFATNAKNLTRFFIIAIFRSVFAFTTPFFLQRLLEYMQKADRSQKPSEEPYLYIFGILVSEIARIILLNQLNYQVVWLGTRVEQMLSVLLYEKQLRSMTAPYRSSTRTNSVFNVDVDDIAGFFSNLPFLFTIPLEIIVATFYLYCLLGVSGLFGVFIMILCLWANRKIGKRVSRLQKRVKKARDERVSEIFEFLHAVRMIRMIAGERNFYEKLMQSRKIELKHLRSLFRRIAVVSLLVHITPFLVTLFAFAVYTLTLGKSLTAAIAFTSIMLFNTLKQPLQILPNLITELCGLGAAVGRVERFLNEPDVPREFPVSNDSTNMIRVGFDGADVAWYNRGPIEFILKNLTIEFPIGKLSLLCGHESSGKSMVLLSLLRETILLQGTIQSPLGSIAYVPQRPWLENGTIRDNILFGEIYRREDYWKVVEACCLTGEFENMALSDMTEYDEKNAALTEAQKACITLARGFYSSARVLLLDDCLSSVDAPKARLILENCLNQGFFNGRTVIAVSQYTRLLLSSADYMVVLGDGRVLAKGTPDEVKNSGALSEEMLGREEDPDNEMIDRPVTETKNWASDEARTHGFVRPRVYWFYMKSSGGVIIWLVLVLLFGIIRSLTIGETYLLKVWSDAFVNKTHDQLTDEPETKPVDNLYYLRIYAVIALVSASVTIARMICQSCVSLKGSRRLFTRPLNAIVRAPLSFFDTAPLGKIMNRFSKDLGLVDQGIVTVMANFLGNLVGAISVLLVVTAVVKEYSVVSVIIAICYIRIGTMYINASRELKQLQSKTRAVVTSWFNDTVGGITVIRAYNCERHFASVFVQRLNTANRTTYLLHMSNRWMSVRMGCIGAVATYLAGVFILWHFDRINAGLAGFALSYALSFVQIVFLLVKDFITMETGLNSVERISEYIGMPQEPPAIIDSHHPPNAWPTRGNIEVTKLVVKYSETSIKPALNNITFSVDPEEKIGIVGRTGSGKTTLANSFLRLIEASDGAIVIDGINIADIGLEDLRSRITLINEDPILFEGTIRSNLDICNTYNDHELWESLRRVNFISIEENPASDQGGILVGPIKSLDDPVNEGGSNFSRGHRQLLCLARALLRQAKIIVMDEAMASIDPEMANKIQEIIRNEFHHATVLCISHRFRTVIDSDRILVLDDGEIAEYDTPYNLIMDPKSLFHYLCEQTGELDSLAELVKFNHPEFDILEEDQEDEAEEAEDEEEEEVEPENAGSSEEEQYNENSQEEEIEYDDVEEHDSLEQESQGDHLSSNERTLSDEATEDQE